jgi:hypothetical protein
MSNPLEDLSSTYADLTALQEKVEMLVRQMAVLPPSEHEKQARALEQIAQRLEALAETADTVVAAQLRAVLADIPKH